MTKTQQWANARRQLKVQFENLGLTRCERCNGNFALSFAHRVKRRFITTAEELMTVALLCQKCHEQIEFSGHENMRIAIDAIIEKRNEYL